MKNLWPLVSLEKMEMTPKGSDGPPSFSLIFMTILAKKLEALSCPLIFIIVKYQMHSLGKYIVLVYYSVLLLAGNNIWGFPLELSNSYSSTVENYLYALCSINFSPLQDQHPLKLNFTVIP